MAVQSNGQPVGPISFTDELPGKRIFIGQNSPTNPTSGDLWLDSDIFNNAGKNFISGVGLVGSSTNLSISSPLYKDVFVVFRNVRSSSDADITITLNGSVTGYTPGPTALFTISNVKTGVTTNHWSIEIPDVEAEAFKWARIEGSFTNGSNSVTILNSVASYNFSNTLTTMTVSASAGTLSGTALIYGVN